MYRDEAEPTEEDPLIRMVLVSPFFDDKDTDSTETYLLVRNLLKDAGLFEEFADLLVLVTPMAKAQYVENGNSIAPKDAQYLVSVDQCKELPPDIAERLKQIH